MRYLTLALLSSLLALLVFAGCGDDDPASPSANSRSAKQVFGMGVTEAGECTPKPNGIPSRIIGDLEGCFYSFKESGECLPGGAYTEKGTNLFVGKYHGDAGTFETPYLFTAKFEDCTLAKEISGHCEHPITVGSGTGVFAGVTGIILMDDIIEAGTYTGYTYTGDLQW